MFEILVSKYLHLPSGIFRTDFQFLIKIPIWYFPFTKIFTCQKSLHFYAYIHLIYSKIVNCVWPAPRKGEVRRVWNSCVQTPKYLHLPCGIFRTLEKLNTMYGFPKLHNKIHFHTTVIIDLRLLLNRHFQIKTKKKKCALVKWQFKPKNLI